MRKSETTKINQDQINEIAQVIDNELIADKKSYATLAYANSILIRKKIFSIQDKYNQTLKKILEKGLIKNAYQTDRKPKQWRIPVSDKKKLRFQKSLQRPKNEIKYQKPKNEIKHKESFNGWYNNLNNREKKGFKRLIFILAIILIIVILYVIPDNRSDLVKDLDSRYVGREWTDYTYQEFNRRYGSGQPLRYEDYRWVYFYPKGNFTVKVSKKNNQILEISDGRD